MNPAMEYATVPLDDLVPHPDNARTGNVSLIAESLEANGQYRPIVVQRSTNYILAGNHTAAAARQLGWERIDVVFVDVDDERAKRILLVDNRSNDVAGYDERALAELLTSLEGTDEALRGTGFDADYLADLLDILNVPPLEDLASQAGDHDPEAMWPVLRFKVPPTVLGRYRAVVHGYPGSDADLFTLLLEWAEAGKQVA